MKSLLDKLNDRKKALADAGADAGADIDEMRGFYVFDITEEVANGTDRGVISIAVLLVESMLRSLYLSDPGDPTADDLALVGPGGALEGRYSLLKRLQDSFIGAETAAAVAALFECNDARLHWADNARFDEAMIAQLMPFLSYSYQEPNELPDVIDKTNVRELFDFALSQLLDRLTDHIANRGNGLE